jgi:hypothetical protein
MAFDTLRKEYFKEHFWYCEVEVDGVTYRFCENRYPLPIGFSGVPSMSSQSFRPAQVALDGGIGVRASSSVSFNEHQDYITYGTINAPVRFWVNWRANNAGYQGGRLSLFSGYIPDDNVFDVANFQQRDYTIESFSYNEKGASITAKDALKMISGDRAKAPRKSKGLLSADINETDTAITLTPAGVGDSEYPASGWGRMGEEVVSFTRISDDLTIVRNDPPSDWVTVAESHGENDAFQLCLYYNETLSDTIYDLYTNYASVPSSQIDKVQWDEESDLYFPGLLEGFITEPTGVDTLVKELAETAPHYQYWDERVNYIKLIAIKPPATTSKELTAGANLLEGSTSISDKPDMRISTVIVRFGQRDPTKDLDEASNYRQAHVRITPDSITKYGGIERYKIINSRWINNFNRAAALRLAARYGRRFEEMPRQVSFNLDAKDGDMWTGDPALINSDLIVNAAGARFSLPVQIISAGENRSYQYESLEHTYGAALPEDLSSDNPNSRLVVLSGNITNINLRTIYDSQFPDASDAYEIVFTFDSSCVAGSTTVAASVLTGSWPELTTTNIKLDVRGLIVGIGGTGARAGISGSDGGLALELNDDIDLTNTGVIGGGGGGGGSSDASEGGDILFAAGGGGAGYENGEAGTGSIAKPGTATQASPSTNRLGGTGGFVYNNIDDTRGGLGGDLGESGFAGESPSDAAGAAGAAIDLNGYTITYINTGTILGAILS